MSRSILSVLIFLLGAMSTASHGLTLLDLTEARIVVGADDTTGSAQFCATILIEEIEKRTHISFPLVTERNGDVPEILVSVADTSGWMLGAEGFNVALDLVDTYEYGAPQVRIEATTRRGLLYGIGHFLRKMDWTDGIVLVPSDIGAAQRPMESRRGVRFAYAAESNSYDAWTAAQFEQYMRELALFGANTFGGTPLGADPREDRSRAPSPSRREMNTRVSRICRDYDLAYWAWIPITGSLRTNAGRTMQQAACESFLREAPRVDAVVLSSFDAGRPRDVMQFARSLRGALATEHPGARIWLDLAGRDSAAVTRVAGELTGRRHGWIDGLIVDHRGARQLRGLGDLPKDIRLVSAPDVGHSLTGEMPVPSWDPALAASEGDVSPNPRPADMAVLHDAYAPRTDGSVLLSDGIHDDVNKVVWLRRSWDPTEPVREILLGYGRMFFVPDVAEPAADGLLALEHNWDGDLALNGSVEATISLWNGMDAEYPELMTSWRWQMHLMRAYYDAYIRDRAIHDQNVQVAAADVLRNAEDTDPDAAMNEAERVIASIDEVRVRDQLRQRIEELGYELYRSIGYQTSVSRYGAEPEGAGAILDALDVPLNDRLWLSERFAEVRRLKNGPSKVDAVRDLAARLVFEANVRYDDVGNVARSPHVVRGESLQTDPFGERARRPTFIARNADQAVRRATLTALPLPVTLRYAGLDRSSAYVLRYSGEGDAELTIDGAAGTNADSGPAGETVVPAEAVSDGELTVTFGRSGRDDHGSSLLNEVWLIELPAPAPDGTEQTRH